MKKNHDLIDLALELVHETEKALLLSDGTRKEWVPKSVVEVNADGTFTMPEKWAKDKGFI